MYSQRFRWHVAAPRAAVYAALVDPDAIAQWRVPDDMSCHVHEFDAREGGTFRISLAYRSPDQEGKSEGNIDTYHGHFARLVPDRQVVEVLAFDTPDPALHATMTITTTLSDSDSDSDSDTGTDVEVVHDAIPDAVARADNESGTRMALAKLAELVEARPRRDA